MMEKSLLYKLVEHNVKKGVKVNEQLGHKIAALRLKPDASCHTEMQHKRLMYVALQRAMTEEVLQTCPHHQTWPDAAWSSISSKK